MLTRITDYLLAQSWQIALLVVVIASVNFLLKNKSAHIRYLLWLIVLAKCLVPPLYNIPLAILPEENLEEPVSKSPSAEMLPLQHEAGDMAMAESYNVRSAPFEKTRPPTTERRWRSMSIRGWLGIGWIVGTGAFLIFNLLRALRANLWLWRRRRALPSELQKNIEDLFLGHGVKNLPKVWLVEGFSQPFVWGLLHGSIYLPVDFLNISKPEHQRSVLGHEFSHVLRFDAAVNILQVIAQAIFWFHPLVWWANKKIRAEREKCCDEMAVARLNTLPRDYSTAIVETLAARNKSIRPVPSLAVAGPVKNIEERIKTMLKPGKKFYKRPTLTAGAVVLVSALLAVPTALVLTAQAEAKAAPTPLHQAAADGNLKEARSLISKGANVNVKDNEGRTPLFYAVENRHTFMCDLLIVKGADINVKDADGDTPLHHAALLLRRPYDFRLAAELARRGADVNATNNQRQTPLHIALEGGSSNHKHIASMLLWYNVNVNAKDSNGKTALHLAAQRAVEKTWWQSVLWGILAKGADVNITDAKGRAALHIACDYNTEGQDVIRAILERASCVNVNAIDKDGVTPLHIAARRGQMDVCETLINSGAKINAKDKYGHTPAYYAVRAGNIEMANSLIKKGADSSSIHSAAYQGNISNLKTLLTIEASVNEKDEIGFTTLHAAAAGGHRDIVEYLISQGADVKAEGGLGWTALSYAARGNHKEVVELLHSEGVGGGKGVSGLLPVVVQRGYREMANILLASGADIDFNNGEPLTTAVRCGNKEIVEMLISKGADVNAGAGGQVPLYAAAHTGRIDIAEYLIDAGANINGVDARKQRWSLEAAVDSQDMKMIEFLLSKGADVKKGGGWSPLHHAVDVGNRDIVMLLIKHGADIDQGSCYSPLCLTAWYASDFAELLIDSGGNVNNVASKWGWAPLHWWSAYGGDKDVFDLFVSKGADVNIRTNEEETILHLLVQRGREPDQVKFVLSRGVDINAVDACGWTALHRAVLYNLPEIVDLLIDEGADVNLKDSDGRTALFLSKERGHAEIVELLKKHGARE